MDGDRDRFHWIDLALAQGADGLGMKVLRILMVTTLLAGLCVDIETAGAAPVVAAAKTKAKARVAKKPRPPAKERVCAPVEAVATGFGKETVTAFAFQNLSRAINSAKDQLASQGAKGFAIEQREVACVDYIDFGGSIGREHKCLAKARVCGQKA
jgi:hypothetical protein